MSALWNKIVALGADATSLDVTTLQGSVKLKVTTANDKPTSIKNLFKDLNVEVAKPSELKVVALTHVSLDADTAMIVGDNPDPTLIDKHQKTVADATAARTAVVKIIAAAIGFKV